MEVQRLQLQERYNMNIFDKIDAVCIKLKELYAEVLVLIEHANEPNLEHSIQLDRYLLVEKMQSEIELLNKVKSDLFKEAGID